MNPFPLPNSVLVLDNCSIHKSAELRKLIEAAGCRLVFLPAYSPTLNPIEEMFSTIKQYLRRNTPLFDASGLSDDEAIAMAFGSIEPQQCAGWVRNAGYFLAQDVDAREPSAAPMLLDIGGDGAAADA
jgi:hypothetical protein